MPAPLRDPLPSPSAPEQSGGVYRAEDVIAQKYRLIRLLGEGGMGAVWLARNLKLEVEVAIKLIRHELATAETSRRLLQEARAAARIEHVSIVRIFDFGETELGDPFIVMEVLTGESLRDVLEQRGRLTAANAVRTLLPIASALTEAHASGIVHRDLKPENIMLVPDKSGGAIPKLVDFGIAKFRRGDGGDDLAAGNLVVGTPDYMSPEQAGGRDEVDEATDVWALGVILYEALTGHVPFGGATYPALIFAIMAEEPPPTHEQLAGDAELWGILQGALAKRSGGRPSMRAFGMMLAEWALARAIESDIAGTSLAAHWIASSKRNPFSAAPPPLSDERGSVVDIIAPTLPPVPAPGGLATEPNRSRLPRLGAVGLAVGALAVAVVLIATRRRPSATDPATDPTMLARATVATTAATPASALPVVAAPSAALPTEPSAAASASPAPTSMAAITPIASGGRPGAKAAPKAQPARKSHLTIAKEPNF